MRLGFYFPTVFYIVTIEKMKIAHAGENTNVDIDDLDMNNEDVSTKKILKMMENEPIFNVHNAMSGNQLHQITRNMGLREILSSHILKDYQYYNAPTKEIREFTKQKG